MSLHPQIIAQVPDETVRVARAAFPQGTMYIHLRDKLGVLFTDTDFARLFPTRGRPAEAPWRLAMVTIMQYVEGLSDRAAADAVRGRIDWKYATLARVDRPRLRQHRVMRVPCSPHQWQRRTPSARQVAGGLPRAPVDARRVGGNGQTRRMC